VLFHRIYARPRICSTLLKVHVLFLAREFYIVRSNYQYLQGHRHTSRSCTEVMQRKLYLPWLAGWVVEWVGAARRRHVSANQGDAHLPSSRSVIHVSTTHVHATKSTEIRYRPGGEGRDDMPPADGSSTRGGSTSVRGPVRSPHTAKLQAATSVLVA